jgi:hypothetical protein
MRSAASALLDAGPSDVRAEARLRRPGEPPRPRRRAVALRGARNAVASTLIIAILVAFAREDARDPAETPPVVPRPILSAPQPAWRPATAIAPLYALDEARFAVRLHPELGREDAAVVGALGEDGPHLRLVLRRGSPPRPSSFFVDLARRAGEVGLSVARSGRAEVVPTRLGPADAAEAVLVGAVERTCLAFRSENREVGWSAAGWLCGPAGRPATPERLACLLARLALAPAADDPALAALFAKSHGPPPATCEAPRAAADHPAPERIPAELFVEAPSPGEAIGSPKPGPSRRREQP